MSEWININEGKPEEGQRILAYFPSSRLNRKSEIGVITWDSSSWNEVTYWMPLPEPPKKKRWKPGFGCIKDGGIELKKRTEEKGKIVTLPELLKILNK